MPDQPSITHRVITPMPPHWAGEFEIVVQTDGTTATIRPTGELCYFSARRLIAALPPDITEGSGKVHIDLAALTFIDSPGVRALVELRRRLEEQGIIVSFVNVPDMLTRLTDPLGITLTGHSAS